ncbi:hypothetical protein IEQ34_021281 [Dendrobium chrysotoxum]|uniref:X8 domain-containing protein n=1 Tax=Dendrobium chrysotoxum TaxID=161865 RepID=A0AAV7G4P2_DENCH|nr:hypothetical protein IEQ34_021281 [Dendrobium chrysotoxum]
MFRNEIDRLGWAWLVTNGDWSYWVQFGLAQIGDLVWPKGYAGTTPDLVFGEKTWCIAKPSSDVATLLANINYACSQVDCSMIQSGHPCFNPDTPISHASIAMNLYYQAKGRNTWNCDFKNSGLLLNTNPSKAASFNRFWIYFQRPVSFSSTSYGRLSSYQTVVMATVLMLDPCSRESPRPFGNKAM